MNNPINLEKTKYTLISYKEELVTFLIALFCLFLVYLFPAFGFSQKITILFIFFFLTPCLYIKYILKRSLKEFGWQWGNWKVGLIYSGISLAFYAPITYILFQYFDFKNNYYIQPLYALNFIAFIFYEIIVIGSLVFLYEFFFRGFLMFYAEEKFKAYAILFQFLFFLLAYFLSGNLVWVNSLFIISALFSGMIAYKSRSIIFSMITSFIFILIVDAVFIKMTTP